jgi:hypothetical protein
VINMARLPVSSIDVSQQTLDWFTAIANVDSSSKRDLTKQIVIEHLTRQRQHHINKIQYFANRNRLTWEQAFRLLADQERKPPYSEKDLDWARSLQREEIWLDRATAEADSYSLDTTGKLEQIGQEVD